MNILLSKKAIKFLKKQEQSVNHRIHTALNGLTEIPPVGDIKKMKGTEDIYRLRIGTYRIIYTTNIYEKTIYILAIDNRGDIY